VQAFNCLFPYTKKFSFGFAPAINMVAMDNSCF
jgi:hypothetical protein